MSNAEHTGKLVLDIPRSGSRSVAVPPEQAPVFRSDGAYIITGGLGGLGLFFAEKMAAAGCGRIVLTARSQPNPRARQAIERLRKGGTDVVVDKCPHGDGIWLDEGELEAILAASAAGESHDARAAGALNEFFADGAAKQPDGEPH